MHQNEFNKQKEYPTALISGLSHDGRGITHFEKKTTFVAGALPNEEVRFRITQKKSNYNEANLIEILKPAVDRREPICKHFGVCGGCSLQHMSESIQLQLKEQTLFDQLKHFGKVSVLNRLKPLSFLNEEYRRKARLGVKYVFKKQKLLIGFREKSSRYLAELDYCRILHPSVGESFKTLQELVQGLQAFQHMPQIEVAIGDVQKALVFRHLIPLCDTDIFKLKNFGENFGFEIYLQPNQPEPIQKIFPDDDKYWLTYSIPQFDLEFLFHPLDFTQINLEMNRAMVNQALELLEIQANDKVLDLFCGIGNFSLPIARFAREVTGVEGSPEMVTRANTNAKHNGISNASFFTSNLFSVEENSSWMNNSYDKILLDPPRAGAIEIIPRLASFGAKKIVYVSCNPATLARDAGALVNVYGFSLTHAGIMNMFPHTSHIEAMAVFEK